MSKNENKLKISICVVALNEEKHLPLLLQNIKDQQYPHELTEIILIDSGSSDRTKEIMLNFSNEDRGFYSVRVLDNEKGTQAAGWNKAIQNASGDVIARIDAHAVIPPEFSVLAMALIDKGEDVVGGKRICITDRTDDWGKVLLAVENSLFGSGFNISRRSETARYVKSLFHGVYRRSVFERAGFFNECLLRTEDNEMHYRIREAGYKLLYDPKISSCQYIRDSFSKMLKQKFDNGFWIGATLGVCPGCISAYHLVPLAFVTGITISTGLALYHHYHLSILIWTAYFLFAISSTIAARHRDSGGILYCIMPLLFPILHIGYGLGTLIGIFNIPRIRKMNAKQARHASFRRL